MYLKKLEPYIFLTLVFLILLISLSPFLYNLLNTPKDYFFTGAHNYPPDYMSYLAQIKAGLEGHLFYLNKFTTELNPQPVFNTIHFTLLGLLGKPLNAHPIFIYHSSRLIFGALYLFVIYFFISLYFKRPLERLCAFSLAVFTSSIPHLVNGNLSVYLPDYTYLDVLFRTTFLPHHLLRNIYFYLLFIFFLKSLDKEILSKKALILLPLVGIHLGTLSPHHSIIFLLTTYFFLFLILLRERKFPQQVLPFLVLTTPSVFFGTFLLNQTFSSDIGKVVKLWEINVHNPLSFSPVFLALGPTVFLAISSLLNKKTYQKKFTFLLVFTIFSLFLAIFPTEKYLPISHVRFLQIPILPALSILAIQGIKTLKSTLLVVLTILSILISIPSYFFSFHQQTTYYLKNPTNFYIKKAEFAGLDFLDKNTKENEVVLANQFDGNLIPGFTGNRVFVGHLLNTYQYSQKAKIADNFFQGIISQKDALALFQNHNIKYVWFGELEAGWGTNLPKIYPNLNLKEIYKNPSVTIYEARSR